MEKLFDNNHSGLVWEHLKEMRINFREAGFWSPWNAAKWADRSGKEHSQREALEHELLVAGICQILAEKIGLSKDEIELLATAALLHDLHKSPKFEKEARGIQEWLEKKGYDDETTKLIENRVIQDKLSKKGYDQKILKLIEITDPEVMKKYAQGDLQGEEDLLSRILFFADEISGRDEHNQPQIMGYKERIAGWSNPDFHTAPRPEYNNMTQEQIELEFSKRIEIDLKQRIARVDPTYDQSGSLVEDIKKWLEEEKMIGEHLEHSVYKEQIDICNGIAEKLIPQVRQVFQQETLDFTRKHRIDYVNTQELGFEEQIIEAIKTRFPDYGIIGEETGEEHNKSDWMVYIDPICGSANLACRLYPFCTNIAFVKNRETKIAFVIDYATGQRLAAVADKEGIFINGHPYKKPPQLEKPMGRIDVDWGHSLELIKEQRPEAGRLAQFCLKNVQLEEPWEIDNFSSSSALAYVALSKLDAFVGGPAKPHDLAAGAFLVKKSGGTVLNWKGESWQINDSQIIAARDEQTAKKILELL